LNKKYNTQIKKSLGDNHKLENSKESS